MKAGFYAVPQIPRLGQYISTQLSGTDSETKPKKRDSPAQKKKKGITIQGGFS